MRTDALYFNPAVRDALEGGRPVVALETTIVAHGMPYPVNLETALAVEDIVRANGATPATIGVLDGKVVVGLTPQQIEFFATGNDILKIVERDIPLAVARQRNAATTVGASLAIAAAAGIRVFVTGGIGAVAPNAGVTFDISADLQAIARYPCLTVCAGTKAFMDVAATLEYLETHSVPVIVYQSEYFPLFYTRSSGHKMEWTAQSVEEIASAFAAQLALGIRRGMLVGNPIPAEDELPEEVTRSAVARALEQAQRAGVSGKAVTPFVLSAIEKETAGRSLAANVALVKNNARVGAQIAVALAQLMNLTNPTSGSLPGSASGIFGLS